MLADITLRSSDEGYAFTPHSKKAADFLSAQIGLIGDRDLTMQDVDVICGRAERRGLVVQYLMRNPDADIVVDRTELRCGTREEKPELKVVK
jgi:hypothetical protein